MALDSRPFLSYTVGTMKVGDLIIFHEVQGDVPALVIERVDSADDDPAALVQFIEPPPSPPNYLHYYDREIELWTKEGTVRVQHAT